MATQRQRQSVSRDDANAGTSTPNVEQLKKTIRLLFKNDRNIDASDSLVNMLATAMSSEEVNYWSKLDRGNAVHDTGYLLQVLRKKFKKGLLKKISKIYEKQINGSSPSSQQPPASNPER